MVKEPETTQNLIAKRLGFQPRFQSHFVPFRGKKCDFLQVFVPRVLIFKKLHLLLHSKMEVQGKNGVENH